MWKCSVRWFSRTTKRITLYTEDECVPMSKSVMKTFFIRHVWPLVFSERGT